MQPLKQVNVSILNCFGQKVMLRLAVHKGRLVKVYDAIVIFFEKTEQSFLQQFSYEMRRFVCFVFTEGTEQRCSDVQRNANDLVAVTLYNMGCCIVFTKRAQLIPSLER